MNAKGIWNNFISLFTMSNLVKVLLMIVGIIVTVIIVKIIVKIIHKSIDKYQKHKKDSNALAFNFFKKVISIIGVIVIVLMALNILGIDLTPILASIGAAGVIFAFAFQETITNFFCGLLLLIKRPFKIGDYVNCDGNAGTVKDLDMMSTRLITPDNKVITLNNKAVWNSAITNFSYIDIRRIDLVVGVAYGSDTAHVKKVLKRVVDSYSEILKDPQPTIEVHNLNESSVDFVVRPWVKTPDYWGVYWKLQEHIYNELNKENISIPFPQMDVHLDK